MSFFFSEPGAPPDNVRAWNTSSTSILVKWDEVPVDKQHGEILRYAVSYWVTEEGSHGAKLFSSSTREVELLDLAKYAYYSIIVSAATVKGDGPASIPVHVRTDEDSK